MILAYWKPIAGALGLILLILLYRSQISSAVERGRVECEAAEREARQVWRDTYDKRRAELHAPQDEKSRDTYAREAQPIRERIIVQSATPAACRNGDAVDGLLDEQRKTANRQFTPPAGGAMQADADRAKGNSGGGS